MSLALINEQVDKILSGLRKSKEVRPLQKEKLKILVKDMALTFTEKGLPFRLIVNLWTLYRVLDRIAEDNEELLKKTTYSVALAMAATESDDEEREELIGMFKREVLKIAEEACI